MRRHLLIWNLKKYYELHPLHTEDELNLFTCKIFKK